MLKLVIMVGNIGTGKTSTTNVLMDAADILEDRNVITVSADCLAKMLFNGYYGPDIWADKHWTLYASTKQHIVREALMKGFDVIVDGSHMSKVNRKAYIDIAKEFGASVDVYLLIHIQMVLHVESRILNQSIRVLRSGLRYINCLRICMKNLHSMKVLIE